MNLFADKGAASRTVRSLAHTPKLVSAATLLAAGGDAEMERASGDQDPGADAGLPPALPDTFDDDADFDAADGPTLRMTRDGLLSIDLDALLRSRMLVTASSGGGKSYAVRRLLEQTAPLVQQIVIDPEGEYESLAEKFPFAVFSERDERTPLSKCSPFLLAQQLLKTGISEIM